MDNLFRLDDQVAVVTGGNGVLGGAMAMGLAEAGARVAILGRTKETVDRQVEQIRQAGGEALSLVADVVDQTSLQAAANQLLEEWSRIDILVNAAGGNRSGATIQPDQDFFDLSIEDFRGVLDLNLTGTVLPTYVFGKAMVERGTGSIINISSLTAQQPFSRVVGYSAAKAGIDNFTKWLAVEMASKYGEGIRVNAIAPGVFIGEQNRSLLLQEDGSLTARGQTIIDHTPLRRFGEPEELIGTVVWLAAPASRFVTGTVTLVDGGFTAFSGV